MSKRSKLKGESPDKFLKAIWSTHFASSSCILLDWRLAAWWWCFTDQLDPHVDFKAADQVDCYEST